MSRKSILIVTVGNTDVRLVVEDPNNVRKVASIATNTSMRTIHERLLKQKEPYIFNEEPNLPRLSNNEAVWADGIVKTNGGDRIDDCYTMLEPPVLDLAKIRDITVGLLRKKDEYDPDLVIVLDTMRDPNITTGNLRDVVEKEPIAAGKVVAAYLQEKLGLEGGLEELKEGKVPLSHKAYYMHYLINSEDFSGNEGRDHPINRRVAERLRKVIIGLSEKFIPDKYSILYIPGGGVGPIKDYLNEVLDLYYPKNVLPISLSEGLSWNPDVFHYPTTPSGSLNARKHAIDYAMKGNFMAARSIAESLYSKDTKEEQQWARPLQVYADFFSGFNVNIKNGLNLTTLQKLSVCNLRSINLALRLESVLEMELYPEIFILLVSFADGAMCDVWEQKFNATIDHFRNQIIFYGDDPRGGLIERENGDFVMNIPYSGRQNQRLLKENNKLIYRPEGKGSLYIETALYSTITTDSDYTDFLSPERDTLRIIHEKIDEKIRWISLRDIRNAFAHGKTGEGQMQDSISRFENAFTKDGSFLMNELVEGFFSTGVVAEKLNGKKPIDLYRSMKEELRQYILKCDVL